MENNEFDVYINGVLLKENNNDSTLLLEKNAGDFSHFYFGAYKNGVSTNVTVTDVLLYNRQLSREEMDKIQEKFAAKVEQEKKAQRSSVSLPVPDATEQDEHSEQKDLQTNSRGSSAEAEGKMGMEADDGITQPQTGGADGDLNPATANEEEMTEGVKEVVRAEGSGQRVVEDETEGTETHPKDSDFSALLNAVDNQSNDAAANQDAASENSELKKKQDEDVKKANEEETLHIKPNEVTANKEKTEATSTAQDSGNADVVNDVLPVGEKENDVVQAQEKEEAAPNATVLEAAGSESPAADNTSLRGRSNASNYSDTLKTFLQLKGGDGAVRSCVSLLPSLCLWCFLTAFYCCQAVAT